MKRKSVYTCLVMLLMSLALQAKDKDVAVAEALLKRLLPDRKSTRLNSSH